MSELKFERFKEHPDNKWVVLYNLEYFDVSLEVKPNYEKFELWYFVVNDNDGSNITAFNTFEETKQFLKEYLKRRKIDQNKAEEFVKGYYKNKKGVERCQTEA